MPDTWSDKATVFPRSSYWPSERRVSVSVLSVYTLFMGIPFRSVSKETDSPVAYSVVIFVVSLSSYEFSQYRLPAI